MKESSKQSLAILAITVFLSGSLFIFFNVIKPGLSKVKGIIAERQNQEENIKVLEGYKAKSDAIIQRYAEIASQIATINMTLPTEPRPAELLSILDAIARTKGVNLTNVVFKEIKPVVKETTVALDQEGVTSTKAINLGSMKPSILQVNLSFVTSYENFKAFLIEIEKERRLMDSMVVSLTPMALNATAVKGRTLASNNIFNYTLTLNAYFQPVNQIKN